MKTLVITRKMRRNRPAADALAAYALALEVRKRLAQEYFFAIQHCRRIKPEVNWVVADEPWFTFEMNGVSEATVRFHLGAKKSPGKIPLSRLNARDQRRVRNRIAKERL